MSSEATSRVPVVYPDSDGEPMADNTVQFDWIVLLKENLDALRDDFVAGDLLWYPVEGDPTVRVAPDVLVAPGRPKGDRGSYRQWEEGGVPPAVVFEVLSPANSAAEMREKRWFYDRHGVDEYYVVDPDAEAMEIWLREGGRLREHVLDGAFRSPRLGVTFAREDGVLVVRGPDGARFRRLGEATAAQRAAERARDQAEQRAAALAERLRALGVDPDAP